jgi:hypothetical protein
MMLLSRLVLLATAFAIATSVLGWWAVPVVAAVYAAISSAQRSSALISGVAAMLGWGALLAVDAARGPIGTLAAELAGILRLGPAEIYALTIAYPGLLAITAAVVARAATTRATSRAG